METIQLELHVENRENLRKPNTETLTIPQAQLTARQLITLRVLHRTAPLSETDQRKAVEQALHAFEQGLYLLIMDGERIENLDERLNLCENTQLCFWRLIPLAGGCV